MKKETKPVKVIKKNIEPKKPEIGDKFMVNDGEQEYVGELVCADPIIIRKYSRKDGVQMTEDIDIDPETTVINEISKQEFYEKVA